MELVPLIAVIVACTALIWWVLAASMGNF